MRELAYVALGSNVGDRAAHLAAARRAIARLDGTRVVGESTVEETAPIGPVEQPPFLNQMLLIETSLAPHQLLACTQAIELAAGRERTGERWGPRTLDVDIVRHGDRTMSDDVLTLPHSELPNRDFWLREIAEIEALAAHATLVP